VSRYTDQMDRQLSRAGKAARAKLPKCFALNWADLPKAARPERPTIRFTSHLIRRQGYSGLITPSDYLALTERPEPLEGEPERLEETRLRGLIWTPLSLKIDGFRVVDFPLLDAQRALYLEGLGAPTLRVHLMISEGPATREGADYLITDGLTPLLGGPKVPMLSANIVL